MIFGDFIFLMIYIFLLSQVFLANTEEEKKTPEQELGDAIAKFLKSNSSKD